MPKHTYVYCRPEGPLSPEKRAIYDKIKLGFAFPIERLDFDHNDKFVCISFISDRKGLVENIRPIDLSEFFSKVESGEATTKTYTLLDFFFREDLTSAGKRDYSDEFLAKVLIKASHRLDTLSSENYSKAFQILIDYDVIDVLKVFPDFKFLDDEDNSHLVYNLIPDGKYECLLAIIDKISPIHYEGMLSEVELIPEEDLPTAEHVKENIRERLMVQREITRLQSVSGI